MSNLEKCRKRIIELIHGVDYEEAIEKELGAGCHLKMMQDDNDDGALLGAICRMDTDFWVHTQNGKEYVNSINLSSGNEQPIKKAWIDKGLVVIIGLPITIGRLLTAIDNEGGNYGVIAGYLSKIDRKEVTYSFICPWKLTNKNGQEATLKDQTEETINSIYNLIK